MGIDLVEGRDLIIGKEGYVYKKTIEGLVKVDVIYRRIDDDYLDPDQGNPKSAIGVKGLIKAWQQKKVAIVNSPGCGIADDKAIYTFLPEIINGYKVKEILIRYKFNLFEHILFCSFPYASISIFEDGNGDLNH